MPGGGGMAGIAASSKPEIEGYPCGACTEGGGWEERPQGGVVAIFGLTKSTFHNEA